MGKLSAALAPRSGPWRALARVAVALLLIAYFAFTLAVLALRYWILPRAGEHTAEIEQAISRTLGERVTIGTLEAGWQGLRPELFLGKVTIYARDGSPALSLPAVEATLAWTSVLFGSLQFHSLAFDRPELLLRRDPAGRLFVAGIELRPSEGAEAGFAAWLLAQRQVLVRSASITWQDERRGAPPLALSGVDFLLENRGARHRFALRARPPAALASALDLRGELRGEDFGQIADWSGRLYVAFDYTDLSAWQSWVDYPIEVRSGRGGLRAWLDVSGQHARRLIADVALEGVSTRLEKDLPLLDLDYLNGRIGAGRDAHGAIDLFGRQLTLRTGTGVLLPPSDFSLRWQPAAGPMPERGEFQANPLELGALARLVEYLPLPETFRQRLAAVDPRGSLRDFKLAWSGAADRPASYSLSGQFTDLGARAWGSIPGFAALSGRVNADQSGGQLTIAARQPRLELPGIVAGSAARFDSLNARLRWKALAPGLQIEIERLAFDNRDIAGSVSGSFATRSGSPGVIDLSGSFERADAAALYRYIPFLPTAIADYLRTAVRAGQLSGLRLRLKGDLAHFPFADAKLGIFEASGKLEAVRFRYAEGWPEADAISGELAFSGAGMKLRLTRAEMAGVQIGSLRAEIPDLYASDERLHIEAEARDQTADFLRLAASPPIARMTGHLLSGASASGEGTLVLRLDVPLRRPHELKLSGNYQFRNNQLRFGDWPPLAQLDGRIELDSAGFSAKGLAARFLGGPATVSFSARADGTVSANAQGAANLAQLPRRLLGPFAGRFSGNVFWRAAYTAAPGRAAVFTLDSPLTGAVFDLPAPLAKSGPEAMPLHLERAALEGATGDSLRFSLGRAISGELRRRRDGERFTLDRGVIAFNAPAVLPARAGLAVIGNLPYVNLDRWRALLSGEESGSIPLASLDMKLGALDFAGRRFHEVALRAGSSGSVWVANVAARELSGEIAWQPQGRGRLVARLKQFTLPEASPIPTEINPASDLPSLDVVADNFTLRGKNLGRVELLASNEQRDWRIERLALSNPDSNLTAQGVWQNWAARPSLSANIKLEVSDVGKFLERIGYPHTMQRGRGTLEGKIGWAGSPIAVDYATLTGTLSFNASKGQFLKIEPGAAKLLGILSLQSWVTLDFRGLFGEGFAFDSLSGTATIAKGVLTTQDFQMRGPSAQVTMSGEVDLAHETQNLRVRVVPALGAGVSSVVGVLLAHPIVGLSAAVLQNILKDPLGQIFAVEYAVTGTWSDPKAERIRVEAGPKEGTTAAPGTAKESATGGAE